MFIPQTFNKCSCVPVYATSRECKGESNLISDLKECKIIVRLFPKLHSGFHNLVFYIFYCDVAKFSNNLKLSLINFFPGAAWTLFQCFSECLSSHRTAASDYKTDPCISIYVFPDLRYQYKRIPRDIKEGLITWRQAPYI